MEPPVADAGLSRNLFCSLQQEWGIQCDTSQLMVPWQFRQDVKRDRRQTCFRRDSCEQA